MLAHRPYRLF